MSTVNHSIAEWLAQARRLSQSGHLAGAAERYQKIIDLQPTNASAHFELGVTKFHQGQHQSAITQLQKAIAIDSQQPVFHNGLGIVLSDSGDLAAGARCFERVLELHPDNPIAYNNLGSCYKQQGKLTDAVEYYGKAISANPQYAEAYLNLSEVARLQGELPAAVDAGRKALALKPESAEFQFNLALTLHHIGQHEEAVRLYHLLVTQHPTYPGGRNNLGLALLKLDRFEEAIASYRTAIHSDPTSAAPHNNLGNALRDQSELDDAIASYRNALILRPDHAQAHSNLLLAMNYLSNTAQSELYAAALLFDSQQISALHKGPQRYLNAEDNHKRLKIGYVSADFRAHSVAHFTRKLMGTHNRDLVEVFCYSNVINQDLITDEFRTQTDHWTSIINMDDQAVADRVAKDQIDILIDLAGHTADNRLLVFGLRPAPIQVNWLGYPNTTGLTCMDYRITDAVADPPGSDDQWYTEELIRLPYGFLCFQTDDTRAMVGTCPHQAQDYITFGSFNSLPKITPDVVRVWSKILRAIPNARLILKSKAFTDKTTRMRYLQEFRKQGVAAERIDLLRLIPGRDMHLAAYSNIDIGLDPFPYNGTTTTCEALWMGVPVISLRGDRHCARVGASILHHAGLPDFLAENEDGYVDIACALATDKQRLVNLRATLREKMRASALMNTEQFTRSLENAYQNMWTAWCNQKS